MAKHQVVASSLGKSSTSPVRKQNKKLEPPVTPPLLPEAAGESSKGKGGKEVKKKVKGKGKGKEGKGKVKSNGKSNGKGKSKVKVKSKKGKGKKGEDKVKGKKGKNRVPSPESQATDVDAATDAEEDATEGDDATDAEEGDGGAAPDEGTFAGRRRAPSELPEAWALRRDLYNSQKAALLAAYPGRRVRGMAPSLNQEKYWNFMREFMKDKAPEGTPWNQRKELFKEAARAWRLKAEEELVK